MLEDPIVLAWQNAPMGEPLSAEENDLAEEGLASIEAGEIVHGNEVSAEIAARHRTAG
jgi:predicted transcriptional regulator